ncbi:MAG TPA: hypothetical protein VFV93_13850, partial [Thermomicrobiales bacterium]|nr:hypothetical protein [Thermomicrobiales bacterium]
TDQILVLSGEGDVLQPDDGIVAIGSGAPYAISAARALAQHTKLTPREIVSESMKIAAELCIFTNDQVVIEHAPDAEAKASTDGSPKPARRSRRKAVQA